MAATGKTFIDIAGVIVRITSIDAVEAQPDETVRVYLNSGGYIVVKVPLDTFRELLRQAVVAEPA